MRTTVPGRRSGTRKGAAAAVAVLVLGELLLTGAAVRWALTPGYAAPAPVGAVPTPSPDPAASVAAPVARHEGSRGVPLRLRVPRLGIDAGVSPVDAGADGALAVPDDVALVGWWRRGALPGSAAGTVVIDGHVDSAAQGRGALFPLARAEPGDRMALTTAGGEVGYRVVARRVYPKAELPLEVFARTGRPRLVLITCGGRFDPRTRHYASNVVVYAVPERSSR